MSTKTRGLNRSRRSFCLGLFSILLVAVPGGYWTLKAQDTQSTGTDTAAKSTKKKRSKKATSDTSTAATDTSSSTQASSTQASSTKKKSKKSTAAGASDTAPAPVQPAPAAPAAPTAASSRNNSSNAAPRTPPPAGSGMVWVNTESKVYHREGDRWYGKTKQGKYMSESDAIKAGYHLSGSKSNQ